MVNSNSVNKFGVTQYVVSTVAATGSYITIQSAITAASSAGGGVVYVKPGSYFESLTIPTNIVLEGSSPGIDSVGIGTNNVTIFGAHTFPATASNISFRNLSFAPPNSGISPLFSINPSSGRASLDFRDCILDDTLGAGAPSATIYTAPTGTGSVFIQMQSVQSIAGTLNISLGANSSINASYCSFQNTGGTAACIVLTSSSATLNSSYNSYNSSSFSCIEFTANGLMTSLYDSFSSSDSSGFYAKASGAFGRLSYADSVATSSATAIDSQITKTIYAQNPDVTPRTNGQLIVGRTGNYPIATTLTAGPGISITNGSGSITVSSGGGLSLNWQVVNASFTMSSGNGYIVVSGPGSNFTLPSTSSVGDIVAIVGNDTATNFSVLQTAGQQIRFGNKLTTVGNGGSVSSTEDGASIILLCTVANTNWSVIDPVGNFSIV